MIAQQKKLIAFDLDGTIFETEPLAVIAVQKTIENLARENLYIRSLPSKKECLHILGMVQQEIWDYLIPGASSQALDRADQLLEEIEKEYLEKGTGQLYPDVRTTLEFLKRNNWGLLIASNGGEGYVKAVIETRDLTPLFDGIYSAGEFATENKGELLRIARGKFPGLQAMVGDRRSDIEAGRANNLITVGCSFGYGSKEEIRGADYLIDDFSQIKGLFSAEQKAF